MRKWISKLKRIENKYYDVFAKLGPGCVTDLKKLIDSVLAFVELVSDSKIPYGVKMFGYTKVRNDIITLYECYLDVFSLKLSENDKEKLKELTKELYIIIDDVLEAYS